jgi:thiol-disulfide isomerase/thioredoxin
MGAVPARRYVQVGVPLLIGAIFLVPLWLGRTPSAGSNGSDLAAGGSTAGGPSISRSPSVQAATGTLPPIEGESLGGSSVRPQVAGASAIVVNVWNPDCPPCREEAPALARAWSSLGRHGVRMVGVMYVGRGWPDDREAATGFATRYRLSYPMVVDATSAFVRDAGIPGIPVTLIADGEGNLRFRILGPVGAGQIESLVRRLPGWEG